MSSIVLNNTEFELVSTYNIIDINDSGLSTEFLKYQYQQMKINK